MFSTSRWRDLVLDARFETRLPFFTKNGRDTLRKRIDQVTHHGKLGTEFLALPAGDCDLLQGHPNHVLIHPAHELIHPAHFISSEGPSSSRALHLAWAIISNLEDQKDGSPDDAGILAAVAREITATAPLLTFL
jgi:hypothetical protein